MKLRVVVVLLVAVLVDLSSSVHAQVPPLPPGWQLERAVLVSRHGVRAPIQANAELDAHAASPWPSWPVPPGDLTPRGFELMRLMGIYYRVLYGGRGLVQSDDCPPTGTVGAWTDTQQRTRQSGVALMTGMYPLCRQVILHYQADTSRPDPLFDPPPSPSCPMEAAATRAAILKRIGGDFSSVTREYARQLEAMHAVLCPAGAGGGARCRSPSPPSTLKMRQDGNAVIEGPIGYAASAAESFLMEAAEGMAPDQVAWGRIKDDGQLADLLSIHRLAVDLTDKTPAVARAKGSNMLAQIVATLVDGHAFPGLGKRPDPVRFALLVGHEATIAHLQAMLKLGWQIPGFQANEATPGGALAFELYREVPSGLHYVRLAYYAQTLQQMRDGSPLTLATPPGMVAVEVPGCAAYARDKACPLARFVEIAKQQIEPACLTIKP